MNPVFQKNIDFAREMDRKDPLKDYRKEFFIPDEKLIYLDGNSLGRLPKKTTELIENSVKEEWGDRLIRSWNEGWYEKSKQIGEKIAGLIGAQPDEVIVADSTTVNLYKLVFAALKFKLGRTKIVTDVFNFPSDLYVFQGLVSQFGPDYQLSMAESHDQIHISSKELENKIDTNTALVSLSHVAFKNAFMYDMKAITEMAHSKGALVLWDLSHSVGAVPVNLSEAHADLAVGCTYKYLNGGPGAPAFLYVRKDLQQKLQCPVWGWFGERDPFSFHLQYAPADSIKKFLVGTPPVLSLSAVEPGVDLIARAGINNIREKSLLQSEYLIFLVNQNLTSLGFQVVSPSDPNRRGSHLTLKHKEGFRICRAMIDPGVLDSVIIPDFRAPDLIRIGIAPLYTRFIDLFLAVGQIKSIVEKGIFKKYNNKMEGVT
jgi:kynureninase